MIDVYCRQQHIKSNRVNLMLDIYIDSKMNLLKIAVFVFICMCICRSTARFVVRFLKIFWISFASNQLNEQLNLHCLTCE